ncbi:hypothetical protein R6Q57_014197 [Mikania cordata]
MAAAWDHFGEIANVAQLTGLGCCEAYRDDCAGSKHGPNAQEKLQAICNAFEQLKISELKKYPETCEPLEQLEDALRRSYILVNSCQDRSYLYLLAMGWNIVYQFRKAQNEIDRYLKIIPLITLVDNARVRYKLVLVLLAFERLDYIGRDQREYVLDDEDRKVQDVIMKPDPSHADTVILKKTLSCSYPNLPFKEVIQKENEKLHLELQRSQANLDVGQCQEVRALTIQMSIAIKKHKSIAFQGRRHTQLQEAHLQHHMDKIWPLLEDPMGMENGIQIYLAVVQSRRCIKTFFFPCGTFSKIASVATNRHMTSGEACNDLVAYSLILSCCCYTCCVRRKLRKMLNIMGGCCDDFLSHVMCCCCALVQELREIEMQGINGMSRYYKND